ncbi:hypothetical protein P3T40_007421 [Paraburkholderia sp. EB58]|jgi:hypothetical protein
MGGVARDCSVRKIGLDWIKSNGASLRCVTFYSIEVQSGDATTLSTLAVLRRQPSGITTREDFVCAPN